jgi:hypothetical protein
VLKFSALSEIEAYDPAHKIGHFSASIFVTGELLKRKQNINH